MKRLDLDHTHWRPVLHINIHNDGMEIDISQAKETTQIRRLPKQIPI